MNTENAPSRWVIWGRRFVSALAIVGMIASVYYFLVKSVPRDPTSAAVACAAITFMVFVANFNGFSSFEAGPSGVKFATREAQKASQEAYATIEHLRKLATVVAKVTLELVIREGTLTSMTGARKFELKQELTGTLTDIGLTYEQVREATTLFNNVFARAHIVRVLDAVFAEVGKPTKNAPVLGFTSKEGAIGEYVNLDTAFRTPPEELRRKLATKTKITPAIDEALLDYAHFVNEWTFRRPELWSG